MKKKFYFKNKLLLVLFFIVTGTGAFAQLKVGDNPATISSSAVLDVESTNKGLLVPRVALTGRTDISTITSPAISLLVYNTATMGTAPNNVVPGYYFWKGSAWVQIVDDNFGSTTGVGGIYKGSGSLSGNTTVTQSTNTLAFTSNAVNGFSVDGATFSVDAANDRVGIGTNSPTEKLDISGNVKFSGALMPNNTAGTSGQVLTSSGLGIAPSWSTIIPPSAIFYLATSIVPAGFLECNGAVVSRITYQNLFAIIGTTYGSGNGTTTFNLPDLRGEFIRGWDDGRGVDTGRVLGTSQAQDVKAPSTNYGFVRQGNTDNSTAGGGVDLTIGEPALINAGGGPAWIPGGTETRPRNIALMPVIKF